MHRLVTGWKDNERFVSIYPIPNSYSLSRDRETERERETETETETDRQTDRPMGRERNTYTQDNLLICYPYDNVDTLQS